MSGEFLYEVLPHQCAMIQGHPSPYGHNTIFRCNCGRYWRTSCGKWWRIADRRAERIAARMNRRKANRRGVA